MIRQHIFGIVAWVSLLLCSSIAATDSLSFRQDALTRGLDRLREVAAASSVPLDTNAVNLPYGVFLSDLDGDGLLDVYVPNHGQVPHRSGLWTNTGTGAFNPNIFTVSLTSPYSAYLNNTGWMYEPVDLNGDGKPDLYFGGWYSYGVVCYNRGVSSAGGWTGPRFECRPGPYPLSFADVNRDRPGFYPLPFADVNRDGKPDILTYQNPSAFDNYLAVLRLLPTVWRLNNGSEDTTTWPAVTSDFDLMNTAPAGALLDLDGDGLPDKIQGIPVASSQRGQFGIASGGTEVYFGQPDHTYALQATGLEGVTSPIAALEDVNRDGCIDIGFDDTNYRDNQYWYLQNVLSDGRCAGTWHWVGRTSPELPHFMGASRQSIDLDNSGTLLDVVLVKNGYGNTGGYSGGIHVFRQQPDETWAEVLNHGINLWDTYYSAMRVGDWNDDGLPDIAAQGITLMPQTDNGIALFTNQSVTANTWVKVRLPELSGRFIGAATIELFDVGQAGISTAKVGQSITLTTGYHWPSTWYHLGAGTHTAVDVRVTFPNGRISVVTTPTNRRVSVSTGTPSPDTPPTVNAGADQTIRLPNGASLHGTISDDGLPNPPGSVSVSWSLVSGPGTVSFSAPTSLNTTANVSVAGSYLLRLSASDGAATSHDELALTVQPAPSTDTTPPTITLTAPINGAILSRKSTVTLTATASDNIGVASVSFYVSGSLKCTDTITPYSCAWKVPANGNKTYQLQANATDAAGNARASALVTVTVK